MRQKETLAFWQIRALFDNIAHEGPVTGGKRQLCLRQLETVNF